MIKKHFKTLLYIVVFIFLAQFAYALNIVELSPGYYPQTAKGKPISLGYIYVGTPDLDPTVVANQKTLSVQQEDGTIVAVAQPIRTNTGGVPVYLGSPVTLLVNGDYSLAVLNSSSVQVYYVPSTAYEQYLVAGNYYYPDYSEADQGVAAVGAGNTVTDILTTVGVTESATMYFSHNSGGNTTTYTFTTNTTITDNFNIIIEKGVILNGAGVLTLDDPNKVVAQLDQQVFGASLTVTITNPGTIYPMWYGVTADGTTDDTTAWQTMVTGLPDGCTIEVPEGTTILSNITAFDDAKLVGNKESCILKHKAASSDHMLETSGDFEVDGVQFDGNKANNTNRVMAPLWFDGGRLKVHNSIFVNSTFAAIDFNSDEEVDIRENLFWGLDEHTGVGGEFTTAIYGTSTAFCKIWVNNNTFLHTPADVTACPGGVLLSGVSMSMEVTGNYFTGFGAQDATNTIGVVDLYTDCDKTIVTNNIIENRQYVGLKLANSDNLTVSGNTLDGAIDDNAATGIYLAYGRAFGETVDDWIVTENYVNNSGYALVGIAFYGEGTTYPSSRIIVSDNIIYNVQDGIQFINDAREVVAHHNIVDTFSRYGVYISSVGKTTATVVNIDGCLFKGANDTYSSIYASANVAYLHLNIRGCTFRDGTPAHIITANTTASLFVDGCDFFTAGSTDWVYRPSVTKAMITPNNVGIDETLTTDISVVETYGATSLDSTDNKVDCTLADGDFIGQIKTIVMTEASNSSIVTIAHHQDADNEEATFDEIDETGVFMWTGTEWITLFATCTFV